jgi:hypothetical protein
MKLNIICSSIIILGSAFIISACSQQEESDSSPSQNQARPDSAEVIAAGNEMVTEAFAAISNALGTAMSRGGIPHAIEYCNVNAINLTDSVSTQYGVDIRRASHKPRNPDNRASGEESASIEAFIQRIHEGRELSPRLIYEDDKVTYHSPIRLVAYTCLSCHGEKSEDIRDQDLAIINEHYPQDEATGFDLEELRGIWSVEFPYTYFSEADTEPED